jgi:16S rRNA (adenine1518-N6/adenine1519-N6)-dimethyltransferase
MSKVQELKDLLQHYGLNANKGLGQNFLVTDSVFDKILGAADLKPDDVVIEVGPGTGFLTERLVEKVKKVIAVEFDAGMVRLLRERFFNVKNLEIVHSDILKFWIRGSGVLPKKYKVVANIPYYITSPLIKLFLQSDCRPSQMVILVQNEVAEKVCGLSDNGVLTLETQLFGKPTIVDTVPPGSFWPPPKVESAILQIKVYPKPKVPEKDVQDFIRLLKFGFNQRRKKLANSLEAGLRIDLGQIREHLERAKIDLNWRAENLQIGDWQRLLKELVRSKVMESDPKKPKRLVRSTGSGSNMEKAKRLTKYKK